VSARDPLELSPLIAESSEGGSDPFGYPRPQLRRSHYLPLNGRWQFALDPDERYRKPEDVAWNSVIEVPYAPETERSGIGHTGFLRACWYRRAFVVPAREEPMSLLLHFGAVDYIARVWVNGTFVAQHEGGYTPFTLDLSDLVGGGEPQECQIVVQAQDDPAELSKPRGKQDWQLIPHSIWYPRTTGIWQSVWLEIAPRVRLTSLRWAANLERWELLCDARIACERRTDLRLAVKLRARGESLADDSYRVVAGEVHRRIGLSDPGIDDSRNRLLWAPEHPTLIEAELELWGARGELLDRVSSYTALRAVGTQGDRIIVNGRPLRLRMVLDQGYWPDSGMTADDARLRRDVELAKAMGFNGVRKHQKIESPRYLYWADRLGLLVWEEMPSAYRYTPQSVERLTTEWLSVLRRDVSHPCIIAWVPFNESWGVPNLPDSRAERDYVQALYHLTRTFDPTRPVIGNDGWESVATDLIGIHDYDTDLARIARRYRATELRVRLFNHERPGGRMLLLDGESEHRAHPIVLSELGGIAIAHGGSWGYSECADADELARRYRALMETIHQLELLSGFCYTQFADTYQEANGLLYADRQPKFPIAQIAAATRGSGLPPSAAGLDHEQKEGERDD
jgi:beta-galactosidase/beta-glucuronidase